jgi:hypothetical protein
MPTKELILKKNVAEEIKLPAVSDLSDELLGELTKALGVPRDVLASQEQIAQVWSQLPRLIKRIPPKLRSERILKACISVACGLFDAAINYVWNETVVELREKVRRFGINVVPQILDDKDFDEAALLDLQDAELLDLCRKLNLINDENYFYLDQCRATRNSFSAAHPTDGDVDEDELVAFLSRCQRHALSSQENPKGVDTKAFLQAVKHAKFTTAQIDEWTRRIVGTFDAQRELIFTMLHGIYCDAAVPEEARRNSLSVSERFANDLSAKTHSALVDRHQDYVAKGDDGRAKASREFFERLGLLALLGQAEVHAVITSASLKLLSVHNGWNNFHNEPPFAERLASLTKKHAVPDSARAQFVEAVVTCGVGNTYGVSHLAEPHYRAMVKSFSPAEVKLMLALPTGNTVVASRIKSSAECKEQFRELVDLIDEKTVPVGSKVAFAKWTL